MDLEHILTWLIENLDGCTRITSVQILEKTYELERILLGDEEVTCDENLFQRFRRLRCSRKSPLLEEMHELSIRGRNYVCSIAVVLFTIELMLLYRMHFDKWNSSMVTNSFPTFTNILGPSKAEHFLRRPEPDSILQMPMSLLFENVTLLTDQTEDLGKCQHLNVRDFELLVEALHARVTIFFHMRFSKEDFDLPDYRTLCKQDEEGCEKEEVFQTNFQFLAEMRLYFDTLYQMRDLWKEQQKNMPCLQSQDIETNNVSNVTTDRRVTVAQLKTFIENTCKTFEREHFLETFTEYVIEQKLNSHLLRNLYKQKFPDVNRPDARRIVKHFRGKESIVDFTCYESISKMFKADLTYSYEFGLLFLLKMVYNENPLDSNNKTGYVMFNPLNRAQYTYYKYNFTCTAYASFLETVCHFFRSGHSRVKFDSQV